MRHVLLPNLDNSEFSGYLVIIVVKSSFNILQLIIYNSSSSFSSLTLSSSIFEHRDRERKLKGYFKISFCRYFYNFIFYN